MPHAPPLLRKLVCASLSSARVALLWPVSSGTPRAPHTRSRPRARGSPGPRAPPIAVSGGGEAPACGARLHLKEEEEEDHEQLGGALDQEGDGDGGVGGAGSQWWDPGGGDGQQVHRPCSHRRWWTDIYFVVGHTHKVECF